MYVLLIQCINAVDTHTLLGLYCSFCCNWYTWCSTPYSEKGSVVL